MASVTEKSGSDRGLALSGRPSSGATTTTRKRKTTDKSLNYVRRLRKLKKGSKDNLSTKSTPINTLATKTKTDQQIALEGRPSSVKTPQVEATRVADDYIDPNTGAKVRLYNDSPYVKSGQYVLASSISGDTQTGAPDVSSSTDGTVISGDTGFTPPEQTLEDKAKSLIEGGIQDTYQLGEEIFGEDLNPEPSSFQAMVDEYLAAQEEEMASAEADVTQAASLTASQIDSNIQASQSQQGAVDAALGVSREGPTSAGNLLSSAKLKEAIARQYNNANTALRAAQQDREDALVALEEAQKSDRSDLVQYYQDALNNAEYEIQKAETDRINALVAQQESDLRIQDSILASYNSLNSLIETGVELNTDSLISIADSLNLPFETVYDYYQGAASIREDKAMSSEEKRIELEALQMALDDEIRGISSEEAKNVDNYMKLVQSGQYTSEELSTFAVAMGIPVESNPVYQAELAVSLAEAKIKQAQASGELVGPMDQLEYAAALAEYYQTLGQTAGVIPTGGGTAATTATQTEYGIEFGFTDGDIISSADRTLTECGQFVNDVLGLSMGDSYSSKYAYVDPSIVMPEPGMAFVMPVTGDYAPNGHTGIVEYYNPVTQMVGVADVNSDSNGKAYHHEIPLATILNGGGFVPTTGTKLDDNYSTPTPTQYSDAQKTAMDSLDPQNLSSTDIGILETLGLDANDLYTYVSQNKQSLAPEDKEKIQKVYDSLIELMNAPGMSGAVGFGWQSVPGLEGPPAGTKSASFTAIFNAFKDNLALPALDSLKGAMSDKDIEFLRNTASSLSLSMDEETFKSTLQALKDKYSSLLNQGTDVSSEDISEYEQIYNNSGYTDAELMQLYWDSF